MTLMKTTKNHMDMKQREALHFYWGNARVSTNPL